MLRDLGDQAWFCGLSWPLRLLVTWFWALFRFQVWVIILRPAWTCWETILNHLRPSKPGWETILNSATTSVEKNKNKTHRKKKNLLTCSSSLLHIRSRVKVWQAQAVSLCSIFTEYKALHSQASTHHLFLIPVIRSQGYFSSFSFEFLSWLATIYLPLHVCACKRFFNLDGLKELGQL